MKRFITQIPLIVFVLFCCISTSSAQCSDQFLQGTSRSNGSGYNWADAFRASCSGKLEYVQFYASTTLGGTAAAGTLKIYNGAGVSTPAVYTQTYPAFSVAAGQPMRVDLTGDFQVVQGQQYTFSLYVSGINIMYYPSFTIYPGGGSWQNGTPSYKHNFKVGILGNLDTETFDASQSISIVPNPSNGHFFIEHEGFQNINVAVYNVLGKKVWASSCSEQRCEVKLDAPKGVYLVRISDGAKVLTRKIAIQ